jgi:glucose/arabinose dehydrogenase
MTTKELTTVAKGVRNTVGFTRHPETKELWFTDNGRDSLGDTIPPDELNKLSQVGEDFGFPACGGTQTLDAGADCSTKTVPQVTLGAHVASLGMKFYTGDQFPTHYKNQVFIAEHGSRNSSVPVGYRVMTVNPETKSYEVFID